MLTLFVATALVIGADGLTVSWDKNYLVVAGEGLPGGDIHIHYLEAYLRSGSTNRDWLKTMIPHRTQKVSATPKRIELQCRVEPSVIVDHLIEAGKDDVTFTITARNTGDTF